MDYLNELYEWIASNDETYKGRYTFEDFTAKMQDPAYAAQMHEWISGIDNSFESRRPLDDFIELVKKKTTPLYLFPLHKTSHWGQGREVVLGLYPIQNLTPKNKLNIKSG